MRSRPRPRARTTSWSSSRCLSQQRCGAATGGCGRTRSWKMSCWYCSGSESFTGAFSSPGGIGRVTGCEDWRVKWAMTSTGTRGGPCERVSGPSSSSRCRLRHPDLTLFSRRPSETHTASVESFAPSTRSPPACSPLLLPIARCLPALSQRRALTASVMRRRSPYHLWKLRGSASSLSIFLFSLASRNDSLFDVRTAPSPLAGRR